MATVDNTIWSAVFDAEDDVCRAADLALLITRHLESQRGIDADECRALYRVAADLLCATREIVAFHQRLFEVSKSQQVAQTREVTNG